MEVLVMDKNLQHVCMIDTFESLIWTERYFGCGNFEIYMPVDIKLLNTIQQDYYVWMKESEQVMIIEEIAVSTNVESGAHMTISGRSLESVLDRRIIWQQTVLDGNLQNGVKRLLNENAIFPDEADRMIGMLTFKSSNDPAISRLSIRAQYTGTNLYEAIETICKTYNLGFRVTLNHTSGPLLDSSGNDILDSDNRRLLIEQKQFVFMLYSGKDILHQCLNTNKDEAIRTTLL